MFRAIADSQVPTLASPPKLSACANASPAGLYQHQKENLPEKAETVRLIYNRYLELGSIGLLAKDLDRRGIRTKRQVLSNGRFEVTRGWSHSLPIEHDGLCGLNRDKTRGGFHSLFKFDVRVELRLLSFLQGN